jgi:hypothetical protein
MRPFTPARALLTAAAVLIAAGGLGAPALARPRKPPVVEAPPPPPPPPPAGPVGLPDRMIADAAGFQGFMMREAAMSPGFTSPQMVAQALKDGAAYEPRAFIRGAVAYGAIAALADQTFVAAIRAAGNSPENRQAMVDDIASNPIYVFQFKGSDAAAGLAREAIGATALQLEQTGRLVRQAAYDVQHEGWSKLAVADLPGRLAAVEAESASGIAPSADQVPVLQRAATGVQALPVTAQPLAPPYSPLVAHALQVAAIAALGEATDEAYERMVAVTQESHTDTCLNMAKLNLYQCLAVAKPNYEDIFCIGQHVMQDTGACMARNTGAILPLELSPQPLAIPSPIKAKAKATAKRKPPHA